MHTSLKYCDAVEILFKELHLQKTSIKSVLGLLEEGNTIPFIARYRKEATGNLDEVEIRNIQERFDYLKELDERKETILTSIESQGKLTDELKKSIVECNQKNELEDLYLPYKPKRRTRSTIAKEKGLEPLALRILEQPIQADPLKEAEAYVDTEKGVNTKEDALSGAQDIVAEIVSENAAIRSYVREIFLTQGMISSKVREEFADKATKYNDYYDFKEMVSKIPSHRYLAIRRGEKEEILTFSIEVPEEETTSQMEKIVKLNKSSPFSSYYQKAVQDAFKRLIRNSVETETRIDLKMKSDDSAVDIFAQNLKSLLLASPLGEKTVIGIDPGLRTGCKCAVVNMTGKFLATDMINLVRGEEELKKSKQVILDLIRKFQPYAIGIGNGTAGRETESFIRKVLKDEAMSHVIVVQVNEAGASVYSASDTARKEFPDLDLTIRGAISIARRLQDPLAELVKVDPKAIGVGQYQHDVHQPLLQQKLKDVVESCVNFVGVELNTASAELLSYVSGIGPTMAQKIVAKRDLLGKFSSREQLLEIQGLGSKIFQQSAGFLRIREGSNPLDASAVHPESYEIVAKMVQDLNTTMQELIGNQKLVDSIDQERYISGNIGLATITDIIEELKKPGRDPRSSFSPPEFREDVNTIADLKVGMQLEGIVTNVAAFGAFVDVGVHQDGLIHISDLSDSFVKDPHQIVKAGDKIKVTVVSVDVERKRISLSARTGKPSFKEKNKNPPPKIKKTFSGSPFANL